MKSRILQARNGSAKGQSCVELAAALMVIVPMLLVVIDAGIVAIGAQINEVVCRDAARAAASAEPSQLSRGTNRTLTTGRSYERAVTVIKRVYYSSLPMKVRDKVKITETVRDVPSASMGGGVDGEIKVGTVIDIYPPFTLGVASRVTLEANHVVPITYVLRPSS
jgi:hypothetical protein